MKGTGFCQWLSCHWWASFHALYLPGSEFSPPDSGVVPFSEGRLPPIKSGERTSDHLGFRSKASFHAFIVPKHRGRERRPT
jgi:hypothetical protein